MLIWRSNFASGRESDGGAGASDAKAVFFSWDAMISRGKSMSSLVWHLQSPNRVGLCSREGVEGSNYHSPYSAACKVVS